MKANEIDWEKRNEAWEARVRALGVERAIYHNGHKPEDYPTIDRIQFDAIMPHVVKAVRPVLPERDQRHNFLTLDFGCGHGRWTPLLAEMTGGHVMGLDPTESLLEHARVVNFHPCVNYASYRGGIIPVNDGYISLLWCCMVLSTILDDQMLQHTLAEFKRVLRPGALIAFTDNTSKVDGRPVRSPYSISRPTETYIRLFDLGVNADLERVGEYEDLGEINTVFIGKVRVQP